jgi:hypothetical protein
MSDRTYTGGRWILAAGAAAMLGLSACDALQQADGGTGTAAAAAGPAVAAGQPARAGEGRKVQRPDIFAFEGKGQWNGLPTLGAPFWVAIEGAGQVEQVVVTNLDNGRSTEAALYNLEEGRPGPPAAVSDGTANALGMDPNVPATLRVVVLRREEVAAPVAGPPAAEPPAADTPAADADADTGKTGDAPEPAATADTSTDGAAEIAAAAAAALDAAPQAEPQAAPQATPAPATGSLNSLRNSELDLAAATAAGGDPTRTLRPYLRIGAALPEAEAAALLARIEGAGLPGEVRPADGGKALVLAGPFPTVGARDNAAQKLAGLGLAGARPVK